MRFMTTDITPENATDNGKGKARVLHDWLASPSGRLLRYALVLLIAAAAVYFSLTGWFQICEVVDSESEGVTRTCSVPNLSNAGVLAAVFFVLLLLWPDLSEFSAFGVTLKRLVQRVDEKVTDTGERTRNIDETTVRTSRRIAKLQSVVASRADDLSDRLELIQNGLQNLHEQGWGPAQAGFGTAPRSSAPPARWDRLDRDRFEEACVSVVGRTAMNDAAVELTNHLQRRDLAGSDFYLEFELLSDISQLEGITLELFRMFRDARNTHNSADAGRAGEVDEILRSIEQLLLAAVSGLPVDLLSVRTAAAVLVVLIRRRI